MRADEGRTSDRPDVTVLVPTAHGSAWLGACLRSLAASTLPTDAFEVVVVQHGPDDGTRAVVDAVRVAHPALRLRHLTTPPLTRAAAKNVGLATARGRWVTVVHDEDRVAPNLLRGLRDRAGEGVVASGFVVDTPPPGRPARFSAPRLEQPLRFQGRTVGLGRAPSALGHGVAKLVPTRLARDTGFDDDLTASEDAVFWARLLLTGPVQVSFCAVTDDAVYYRSAAPRRTRPAPPAGTLLAGLERLHTLPLTGAAALAARAWMVVEETDEANRVLRAHPDGHREAVRERGARGLSGVQPARLNRGVARDLAILYLAVPLVDTAATVAARRVREAERVVDVLTLAHRPEDRIDRSSELVWRDYVGEVCTVDTPPVWVWWPGVTAFVRRGMAELERRGVGERYRSVYSRSTPLASHVLSALVVLRHPHLRWVAEFSDPLLHDIDGSARASEGPADPALLSELRRGLEARGVTPPASDDMFLWAVTLAYALADEVVFTNDNQRDLMLEDFPDRALAARAAERAVVRPHPVPSADLYGRVRTAYALETGVVHLGYFGVLYATRGLGEVVDALQRLDPATRARVRLHVFTRDPDQLAAAVADAGLADVVHVGPYVGYLEYLDLCTRLDVLLVMDARTAQTHAANPYLPSKYSDYVGSGTDVWGIVEEGSELSRRPLAHRTLLGDVAAAVEVLEQLASAVPVAPGAPGGPGAPAVGRAG
ncbi:hypothetical protein GCM10023258_19610 [Terrabacter aeriphilus]|uniref:Glycosyltransferase 2-like domain-containing protein n=1 Tax=Terrabacter aeriphilus TaxID=515662 RepID=A0ABP9JB33_9MICO